MAKIVIRVKLAMGMGIYRIGEENTTRLGHDTQHRTNYTQGGTQDPTEPPSSWCGLGAML